MAHQNGDVLLHLADALEYAAQVYAGIAKDEAEADGVVVSLKRCVFSVALSSHSARRRCFGRGREKKDGADVMTIFHSKQKAGQMVTNYTYYDTAQLQKPYHDLLQKSADEAYGFVEDYIAGVVVDFLRRVDGAFLPSRHVPVPQRP